MKTARRQHSSRPAGAAAAGLPLELAELRARLADAEEALRAVRAGEVDTVMVAGTAGSQVFTLDGAEHAYRVLIESMNEGALTLTAEAVILYTNQCFARMVQLPLERVIGSSFLRFLSATDQLAVRRLLKRAAKAGSKIRLLLRAGTGAQLPVLISIRPLTTPGARDATLSMVVTDMTEARRSEERLRALSHRLVDMQETERRRVAVELHENISQLTYAILMRCDTLARTLPAGARASRAELLKLRDLLDQATEEVRRIAQDLRPSALDDLGLLPVLRRACELFAKRASVRVNLKAVRSIARLPAAVETALYRVLQETLLNVEQHARARHVTVGLRQLGRQVQLVVTDDGIGFDPNRYPARQKGKGSLGLLGMRERTTSVGGALEVQSAPGRGTTIRARIPFDPDTLALAHS
ncbi:MAG: PAS domain-containing protein [Verrucomicrobia bacterium]|nr:PAS domain-containing protein [Verrucomicrobiota bacterium]